MSPAMKGLKVTEGKKKSLHLISVHIYIVAVDINAVCMFNII